MDRNLTVSILGLTLCMLFGITAVFFNLTFAQSSEITDESNPTGLESASLLEKLKD